MYLLVNILDLVYCFRCFGETYKSARCHNSQSSTLNANNFLYTAIILTLWCRKAHALHRRVRGSIPEQQHMLPPVMAFLVKNCKVFSILWGGGGIISHEKVQSRNLYTSFPPTAPRTGVGAKVLNPFLIGQVHCCRLPLGVILSGQRHVGDTVRDDLRLPNRDICVCACVLQLGHHVSLPGDVIHWLHKVLPSFCCLPDETARQLEPRTDAACANCL